MPPKRPRSHINADKSIARITQAFLSAGWSVEELDKDYGEDLFVRIFHNEEATQYTFFVQAKSSQNLARYKTNGGKYIRYPIDISHLDHWTQFWEPVILVVWDSLSDIAYWEVVQSPEKPIDNSGRHARFYVPIDNILDSEGLMRIAVRTRSRHERFERERHGAQVLIHMLGEILNIGIEYDPQAGFLIITEPSGEKQVTVFGRALEMIKGVEELPDISGKEEVNKSIQALAELCRSPRRIQQRDSEENIVGEWVSANDFMRHIQGVSELEDE